VYYGLKESLGVANVRTLDVFFKLFDVWIGLYRLNKCDEELREVVPECRKRDKGDVYMFKAIQALAFTRWKQHQFREAVTLFHEMEGLMAERKSSESEFAALFENIAHTYSSLGDLDKAEDYFNKALDIITTLEARAAVLDPTLALNLNRGGVLLGLGIIQERRNKPEAALPVVLQAYNFYKSKFEAVSFFTFSLIFHFFTYFLLFQLGGPDLLAHSQVWYVSC
jgi:tetratricopeptide (TPR) repeat protein